MNLQEKRYFEMEIQDLHTANLIPKSGYLLSKEELIDLLYEYTDDYTSYPQNTLLKTSVVINKFLESKGLKP